MIRRNGFVREAVLVCLGTTMVLLVGIAVGRALVFLQAATLGYLVWHLFQIHQLWVWLRHPKTITPVRFAGIWREVFEGIEDRLRAGDARSKHKPRRRPKPKLNWVVKQFDKSVSGLSDAAVLLGQDDEVEWWNTPANKLLGIGRGDDRGKQVTHLFRHPEFIGRLRKEKNWHKPLEVPSPVDSNTWLTILVVPAGKNKRLLQARDSTRLHRLEQVRRDFVANVSHELRTPLTVINAYVETLLDRDDTKALPWYPILPKIHRQTERMEKIVGDLLLLSGLELAQKQPRQEHVLVAAMLEVIREEALALGTDLHHHIEIDAQPGLGIVGNSRELRSALSNLVFNAVRYTAASGKIILRWYRDDQGGYLLVRDTGIGIDARHLPRITERFYRVDAGRSRETGGTGLGLTIVKHVLAQHDAVLSIESVPGHGSDFTCHFPPARLFENGNQPPQGKIA
ncbi:MAG: phosphate regulon sensor histidine kinase PhoR [Gammaproteobacteria bacterium]|nr:phosphate regulon sensor histidine kinase PhoR [Gammaproteobacteria bacterium]